jgi:hypothetical protein
LRGTDIVNYISETLRSGKPKGGRNMMGFSEKWERVFMAVAFAEAGEFATVGNILKEKRKEQKREIQPPRKITRASAPDMR